MMLAARTDPWLRIRALGYDFPSEVSLMAVCPDCEADVEMDEYDIDKGEIISCPECGVELEVLGLAPLELDLAPQDAEEWQE
jgi:alpha-aminoadipate carrier protein LysW